MFKSLFSSHSSSTTKNKSNPLMVGAVIATNEELGEKLGLSGTPAFIVGGEVVSGAVGLEPLREAVAMVRRCGKATC